MNDYKKFELLKLNIKQFLSEAKSNGREKKRYKLDKLIQRLPVENVKYEDLSPESYIKNGEEYLNALHWALKSKKITNIALAGPYGSGKSSIIQSYLAKYPSTKALNISLATFDLEKETDDNSENEIELGILKQLFYKVDSDKIPQSRYRKIKKKYYRKYLFLTIILTIIVMSGIAFFAPNVMDELMSGIIESGNYYGMGELTSYSIAGIFGIIGISILSYIIKWSSSKFRVKEVNIADKATVADERDEDSIFDKSMDEIMYFFEATDYNIVFIEDLDRFESTKIFVKLRELNTILNNYDLIKRRIVFVYAIKDDMFIHEERTKFFDFIIPVIPFINSTNSGEILRDKLQVKKQEDGTVRSSLYDISSSFITLVSPFIEDMRVLTNICNEFIIYKNTLNSVNLKDEEMFSIIIFKNLYPSDFAELESEKGVVKRAFEDKKTFINVKQLDLKKEKEKLEEILNGIEKDILNGVNEVKAAFLNYLSGTNEPLNYCCINGRRCYYYRDIMGNDFDMDLFKEEERADIRDHRGNSRQINCKSDTIVQEYLDRIGYLRNSDDSRKEEMRKEMEDCEKEISGLYTHSLMNLMELYGSDAILSENVRNNKFLVFLLRKGFINENYADYINYFHPNSITKDEMNYIRGIRMQEAVGDFSYTIRNVAEVCDRIEDYEFRQKEALNFDIADYLISKKRNSNKCKELFIGLSAGDKEHDEFIKAYIDRKQNIKEFINMLCKHYAAYWTRLACNDLITEDSKYSYFSLILEYADLDSILYMNNFDGADSISSFLEDHETALSKLAKVSTNRMIQVIEQLDIQFCSVSIAGADVEVLKYIFKKDKYILNINMLEGMFELICPNNMERLKTSNYTFILEVGYEPLLNRIYNDFEDYVKTFILGQETNTDESLTSVEDIIERLFDTNVDLCLRVLDKSCVSWENISDCCVSSTEQKQERKNIWDYVLKTGKVKETRHNYLRYHNDYGITSELLDWFSANFNLILQEEETVGFTEEILKELIVKNISLNAFNKIVELCRVDCFDCRVSSFDEERLKALIENDWIPFTVEYLEEIKNDAPKLVTAYVVHNILEFIDQIENISLGINFIGELFKSTDLEDSDKLQLFVLFASEDVSEDIAKGIRNMGVTVGKEYAESAWNLLNESDRYQLLLNQLEIYTIEEISEKFKTMASVYKALSDTSRRHKEYLDVTDYNRTLLQKLQNKTYITSYEEESYEREDVITHQKQKMNRFGVWIKQRQ